MANNTNELVDDIILLQSLMPVKFIISSNKWENIQLQSLPTNYAMLMMNIDYPDKAKDNPNGSLFMKPSKEILQNKSSDIGNKFFGGKLKWDTIYNYKFDTIKESYNQFLNLYKNNDVFKYLIEAGPVTGDIYGDVAGEEINQETAKRKEQDTAGLFDGSPIDAIDKYITNSIPIVEQLARAVSGKNSSELKNMVKILQQLNSLNDQRINDYLDKNNEVLALINKSSEREAKDKIQSQLNGLQRIVKIQRLISKFPDNYYKFIQTGPGKKFATWLSDCEEDIDGTVYKKWKDVYLPYIYVDGKQIINDNKLIQLTDFDAIKSVTFANSGKIGESLQFLNEDENVNNAEETLEQFNFDEVYNNILKTIQPVMQRVCISDPSEWQIIQNAKTRMEKLKEACDKEINSKIEIICRTVQNGSSSMGEKFKAAISKHPMRADGLKNIWARYSDDLNDRIESRIKSITGDNGNSNMFMPIKQFLTDTYPSLIAMMITWKCVLTLCQRYTNKYPVPIVNIEKNTIGNIIVDKATINILKFYNYREDENSQQN